MIVNMSLEQGIVPDDMKLAKVIPVYKAKSRDSFTNYRLIAPQYLKNTCIGESGALETVWLCSKT